MDKSLSDDMVKLVRFSIVNIERDHESRLLGPLEEIVDENMTDDAFSTWMILRHGPKIPVPPNISTADDPRKYLRVSYEVVDRWPKQDRKYEKRQLDLLQEIRTSIDNI